MPDISDISKVASSQKLSTRAIKKKDQSSQF
ncbi:hypothetical protein WwAna0549 [Wolbachia endosymbiont of Drosophila ananassae]|nr:hypothetical protein WwAna0382 [Wolbachia endosymbiont of Drosophila ananassae]EAL57965.1 hypothetical protein WwAna0549 [Wolbachia endosymbiont of Drosophila ananassae]